MVVRIFALQSYQKIYQYITADARGRPRTTADKNFIRGRPRASAMISAPVFQYEIQFLRRHHRFHREA